MFTKKVADGLQSTMHLAIPALPYSKSRTPQTLDPSVLGPRVPNLEPISSKTLDSILNLVPSGASRYGTVENVLVAHSRVKRSSESLDSCCMHHVGLDALG